jgi:hypothetical protein
MNSYILKDSNKEKSVLLYQEKKGYTWSPKKNYQKITKITVLDKEMLGGLFQGKVEKKYNRLLKIVYALITSEDTTSGDVLVAYTEIERIKQYLLGLEEYVTKEFIERYLNKLYILELELKKIHVMELEDEIDEERGKGR